MNEQPTSAHELSQARLGISIRDTLIAVSHTLTRLLELAESPRRNYLSLGTRTGGGTIGTASSGQLNANPRRGGLSVQNTGSAGNLTVGLGQTSPSAGTGIVLAPGASWDGRVSGQLWLGSVTLIGDQASVSYSWLEA